jgi:two-component system sensor histidine kinase BaeS
MSTRRVGIVAQTVFLAVAIALITALVAAGVALPLLRDASVEQGQQTLGRLADLTSRAIERRDVGLPGGRPLPRQLSRALEASNVTGYLVSPLGGDVPGLSPEEVQGLLAGERISGQVESDSGTILIEGRPLSTGGAVVLQQGIADAGSSTGRFLVRFVIALVIGLLIASLVGYVVARRLTRPLREARDAADSIAEGSRDVVVEPRGPREVADIANAINAVNSALVVSEGRQRDFLLSVSHELRTPLTTVKGYAEALADGVIPGADAARTGEVMSVEASRLDRLVADLLDLARLGAVDFRIDVVETSLQELMTDASRVWTDRCARDGVNLNVEIPATPTPWRTDPVRVRQILDNLMENALRMTPTGAGIWLTATDADPITITVRDSGPGLTEADIVDAFQPGVLYERYLGQRPVGTGIGLALVGRLARGLGGQASVSAEPGSGACFTVTLPRGGA